LGGNSQDQAHWRNGRGKAIKRLPRTRDILSQLTTGCGIF
jgi:hypothetical protein